VKVLVSQFDWRVSEKPQNRLGIVGVSAEVWTCNFRNES
jgi:hypothetical protein